MKNSATTKQIKVKPKRLTMAERNSAKRAQKESEQLAIFMQNGAFHREYLEIELNAETAKYEAIQARLAELQPSVIETEEIIIEEELETVEPEEETDIFDEIENLE